MTLKEIASMAGVSVATVSYVLNNTAQVSDDTRQRVEKIIKETGYRSNMLAKGLRKNETHLVGIIVEDITVWQTNYIIDGINEMAEKNGYNSILCNLRLVNKIESRFEHISVFQKDIDKALDVLIGMQADGVIYVSMHDRKVNHLLHAIQKPVVYCDCYTDREGSSVRSSNKKAAYQLTQSMIAKGHRDFGIISGPENSEPAAMRFEGVKEALADAGIRLRQENIACGNWDYRKAREAAQRLLRRKDYPHAVIAMSDKMAMAVYHVAGELGLRIPEDVSVTGFDNADFARFVLPRITTVDRPLQEMGRRAMEILLGSIRNKNSEGVNLTLPCRIIEGDSVLDLNRRS